MLSEVVSAWGPTQRTTHAEYLDHSNRPGILGPGSERFLPDEGPAIRRLHIGGGK